MEIFFYCNHSNSRRGFYLTKLCDTGLTDVSLSYSDDKCEMMLDRFFSYDYFRVLWLDIPKDDTVLFNPEARASIFGLRGFTGEISGRKGYLNLAFLAKEDEMFKLKKIIGSILDDIEDFVRGVFGCLSVGEKNGYEINTERFGELLDKLESDDNGQLPVIVRSACLTQRDLLRFAVFSGSWEHVSQTISQSWIWKIRPKQAIDENQFLELFGIY